MSNSSIFTLVTNDGKQDRMLMATELLNKRLKEISATNYQFNKTYSAEIKHGDVTAKSVVPTLKEISDSHMLFMYAHYKPFVAIAFQYSKVHIESGNPGLGGHTTFAIPQFGDFFHDMVLHVKLSGLRATEATDKVKYCDFPGMRLIKNVRFEVSNNTLDSYGSEFMNFYYQRHVPPHKKTGWMRNMGQEIPHQAYFTPDPENDEYREYKWIADGFQTLKREHEDLEMWIPLLFWFNLDVSLAIPSVSIPQGHRFIHFQFASATEMADSAAYGGGSGNFTTPSMTKCDLYINNIFVNPEIHDIFIQKIGFNLIRVFKQQILKVNQPTADVRLPNLRFPVESLYFCIQPEINITGTKNTKDWHRCTQVVNSSQKMIGFKSPNQIITNDALYDIYNPVVDTLSLHMSGVKIYDEFPATFFNGYSTWKYGKNLNTPDDSGVYAIHFNFYPGEYQPSGHINVSRAREFYLKYTSSFINSSNVGNLIVIAVAINFLIIDSGSATLRYST